MDSHSELISAYRTWILQQQLDGCTLSEDADGNVIIKGEQVRGGVNFYELDGSCVVELRLERISDGETEFFLHFELEDLERAKDLMREMATAIYDLNHKQVTRVLLCCTCGMTTTYFANKLNETAEGLGLDYEFSAVPIEQVEDCGADYAAVLLAPQVGYKRKELAEALPDTLIIELPGKVFGSYDAAGVLRIVVEAVSGNRMDDEGKTLSLKRPHDKTKVVLSVSYILREDEPTLAYRVYDHGDIALSGMLVRRRFDTGMFRDLMATLRVEGWELGQFDAIGIAVPGMADNGDIVAVHEGKEFRHSLAQEIGTLSGTTVYVDNNATAAAVGCYVTQDTYENVVFHAQAIGIFEGTQGYVIQGKPLVGRGGRSGHLGCLARRFKLDMDLEEAAWRVNGMRQLVASYLTSVACTIAPEVIYVWCDLLPDMDELREEMETMLPATAVPELVGIANYEECVLMGELALCLNRLAEK